MQGKIGKILIVFLYLIIVLSSASIFASPSPRIKISVRLFASIKINKIEIEVPSGPGYQISIDDGSTFDINAGKAAQIIQKDSGLEFTIGERTVKVQKITISQKRESDSYLLLSTEKTEKRLYSGNIIINSYAPGSGVKVINICCIEELVDQTLLSEFSSLDNPEALKAVSVVIRTYLLYHRGRHQNEGYDYCDSTHCQAFKGWNNQSVSYVNSVRTKIAKLLEPARNIILIYDGHIVEGYYSACCGGKLATPEIIWDGKSDFPYRNAKSPFCSESKFFRWQREMSKEDFISIFGFTNVGLKIDVIRNDEDKDFVRNVVISDSEHKNVLSVGDFRRKIAEKAGWNKILSHSFWIEQGQNKIIFKGNGFGHSIGLCEACAYEMGRRGYNWINILDFFYFQAELTPLDKLSSKLKIH